VRDADPRGTRRHKGARTAGRSWLDLFRNRAGTLALVVALTMALWALVFAIASIVWGF